MEHCVRGRPRRSPEPPKPAFGRSCAQAGAIDGHCPSPSSLGSTLPWFATRVPSSRTPRTTGRSGAPTSTHSLATDVLDLFRGHDQPAVVFTDRGPHEHDFIIAAFPTGRELFDDYVGQNREHAEIVANGRWRTASANMGNPLFHICAIGTASEMLGFEDVAHQRFAGRVQTFVQRSPRYLGTMCEILAP